MTTQTARARLILFVICVSSFGQFWSGGSFGQVVVAEPARQVYL